MAFKRRTRRTRKGGNRRPIRKNFRKKSRKYAANAALVTYMAPRMLPYPPRYRCKFTTGFMGSTGSGVVNHYIFSAKMNSLHVPFNGGGWTGGIFPGTATLNTLQPVGFSNMCSATAPYNSFRVFASKCQVRILPVGDSTQIVNMVLIPHVTGGGPNDLAAALEHPFSKARLFNQFQSTDNNVINNFITTHRLLGVTKRALADDISARLTGDFSTDPSLLCKWALYLESPDGLVLEEMDYVVTIEYYVELFIQVTSQLTVV